MERIAPSARLEAQIEQLLGDELAAHGEKLSELGRLGARLVLQRAVEDEVTAFLNRGPQPLRALCEVEALLPANMAIPGDPSRNRRDRDRDRLPVPARYWRHSPAAGTPWQRKDESRCYSPQALANWD